MHIFTSFYRPFDRVAYAANTDGDAEQILAGLRTYGLQGHRLETGRRWDGSGCPPMRRI